MSNVSSGNLGDLIKEMGENNPGALGLLMSISSESPMTGLHVMLNLKEMGIRGTIIWATYKYFCNGDVGLYIDKVENKDPKMIEYVNRCKKEMGLV